MIDVGLNSKKRHFSIKKLKKGEKERHKRHEVFVESNNYCFAGEYVHLCRS